MRKVFFIAKREYLAMIGSKAFLISIAIMPMLMMGGAVIPQLMRNQVDLGGKRVAILHESPDVYDKLEQAIKTRNQHAVYDPESGKQTSPKYQLESIPGPATNEIRLELSDRVRRGDLYGFIEIPPDILETPHAGQSSTMVFYAENTALSDVKGWFDQALTRIVQSRRLQQAGIDPQVVQRSRAVSLRGRGLFELTSSGDIKGARDSQEIASILLPLGIVMFMFMIVMMSAQPMLESVLEEKSNRIAEVLLGSAKPMQIMAGKLFGNVTGSLTVATVYLVGAYGLARYNDVLDLVPLDILPWLVVFQLLAVLMYSSVFMAIGAAVNQLKEAQSLLLPVWFLIVTPLFVWLNIVREPTGSFATWFSLIPPFIPMLMCLRMAASSAIPIWQPVLGLVLMLASTTLCVFAAGRVFRVGMLAQGRAPKFTELIRWAISG